LAVRTCPHCKTEISAPQTVARSSDIECPKCGARLEVSQGPRTVSSLAGLAAGAIAYRLSSGSTSDLGSVLPALYAILAFGVVSPLVLILMANLRNAPAVPVAEASHASGPAGHDAGGHGGRH
jgi:hypothetical protein